VVDAALARARRRQRARRGDAPLARTRPAAQQGRAHPRRRDVRGTTVASGASWTPTKCSPRRPTAARILDARAPERYRGEVEPIDKVAGHVPGARNHPFGLSLDAQGRFLPRAVLREALTASLDGVAPEPAIAMCGSGVTACHLLLALEHAGLGGGRLYAGSWSEWSSDPARPVSTGAAP
jgi:3-mercaptopyruvate sulfurtransferase SseA